MDNVLNIYMQQAHNNHIVQLLAIALFMDTTVGLLAAVKKHKTNFGNQEGNHAQR